ncbi:hypothetical protein HDV03_002939 [Kappamyces sp. JEL0829]|nr:hypothetical protein HDV03_002939 [Kappamyces sp. JEL0829]
MSAPPPALAACDYKTGRTLGQGSYGIVKEGVKIATGDRFAIKLISKKLMRGREALIVNEINILKKVSKGHKNVVTLHDFFESPNNLYLVMDLCTGGELFDRILDIGHFYEEDAAKIIKTTCDATAYLHEHHIVHRDIKPENLIFKTRDADSELLLADFGLSRITDDHDTPLRTYVGTPGYMAPEILQKTGHGRPVDVWAIGVMSYFLLAGNLPFESQGQSNAKELDNITKAKFDFDGEYWSEISAEAKEFISSTIVADPSKRLTAAQCLNHKWLNPSRPSVTNRDLLPHVKNGFDARKMFRKAIDVVKAVNKLSQASLFGSRQRLDRLAALDSENNSSNASNDSLANGILPHDDPYKDESHL